MDPFWLTITKTISSPLAKAAGFLYSRVRRPTVEYRRAPKNFFAHVKPGVSVARMKEVLGTPHAEGGGQYRYAFSEACVQIDSEDAVTVDSVSVGLTRVTARNHFHIWPIHDLVLGKTSFASVIEAADEVIFDSSTKFYHFYIVKYYGFPGFYWNYAMGVLECVGVAPDEHFWSPTNQSRDDIPPKMKINWACVTRCSEPPAFNYFGFF